MMFTKVHILLYNLATIYIHICIALCRMINHTADDLIADTQMNYSSIASTYMHTVKSLAGILWAWIDIGALKEQHIPQQTLRLHSMRSFAAA